MTALLDVNVLVALFDPVHPHHEVAHRWFAERRSRGWATCPHTENGLVRVLSNPGYPGRRTTVADAIDRLSVFRKSGFHRFWADAISLIDGDRVDVTQLAGHRQITDAYLLALAVHHDGCLATFDRSIQLGFVPGASSIHLEWLIDQG